MTRRVELIATTSKGSRPIDVLIDEPNSSVGRVILLHGFARKPAALDHLAHALVESDLTVIRPHLPSFKKAGGINDGDFITGAVMACAGIDADAGPLVMCGHSAGGAAATHATAALLAAGVGVRGLVLIDANESLSKLLEPALEALTYFPVRLIAAAPSKCNRDAEIAALLMRTRVGLVGIQLTTGTHCDAEGDRADFVCRRLCGAVDPANAEVVRDAAVQWLHALAAGDHGVSADGLGGLAAEQERVAALVESRAVRVLVGTTS